MSRALRFVAACGIAALFVGCGTASSSGAPAGSVAFGADDTVCASAYLPHLASAADLAATADCLVAEFGAGRPVVWDIALPTVEGDTVYRRYDFDGDSVVVIDDDRLDNFGQQKVDARRCSDLSTSTVDLPVGVGCVAIDHPGFIDAQPGNEGGEVSDPPPEEPE